MKASIHDAARAALMLCDPAEKCAATAALRADWTQGRLGAIAAPDDAVPIDVPGRPPRPSLVEGQRVPKRGVGSREGHAALLHAIAHIEFNAINLALDCVCRFRSMPASFHDDWLRVAAEEAFHFGLVRGPPRRARLRLRRLSGS